MKKIISVILAAAMLFSLTAAARDVTVKSDRNTRAILLCYDESGSLVYSKLLKSSDGEFNTDVPAQYDAAKKKVYFIDTQEFKDLEASAPAVTEAPEATASPADAPKATQKPAAADDGTESGLYKREVDGVYAPALVADVEATVNSENEDIYEVTVFYHGKEIKAAIEDDLKISTAPEAYSEMKGKTMDYLEKGDVICLTANIAGDEIREVDFITRPASEDIVTGGTDYGTNFEQLVTTNGSKVAGKWSLLKYGEKPSSDKYQYAYGIVGKMSNGTLTLLNTSGVTDDALEIDVDKRANVYICDVDGKEYEVEIGDAGDIAATIPSSILNKDEIDLNDDYSYNYALVRLVDGTATDIILYNNYNN